MLTFIQIAGTHKAFDVIDNEGKKLGIIRGDIFFPAPGAYEVVGFVGAIMQEISLKMMEERFFKGNVPTCPTCGGTPFFPRVPGKSQKESTLCMSGMHRDM